MPGKRDKEPLSQDMITLSTGAHMEITNFTSDRTRMFYSDPRWTEIEDILRRQFMFKPTHDEFKDLMKFLCIKASFGDTKPTFIHCKPYILFSPTDRKLDKSWHDFILSSTDLYDQWCRSIFLGQPIQHTKVTDTVALKRAQNNTRVALKIIFSPCCSLVKRNLRPEVRYETTHVERVRYETTRDSSSSASAGHNASMKRKRTMDQEMEKEEEESEDDGAIVCA